MRALAITPKTDPDDDLLGFIHTWMSRLAQRVDYLYVLQLWSAASSLPSNTTTFSLGKDGGVAKPRQLARFARIVGALCLGHHVDAVLAHMAPVFAVCAAPFARAAGVPLVLWYAHGAVSPMLRLAHALVDRVGTSSPAGFRLHSTKVRYTGQGIDTDRFLPPSEEPTSGPIVSVGRISPIKNYETLLRAIARLGRLGLRPELQIVGGTHSLCDARYLALVRGLVQDLRLWDQVSFHEGVSHRAVASVFQRSTLFVSGSQTGSLDKALLEALSCARLALTCNAAGADFYGPQRSMYTFRPRDSESLAERLAANLTLDPGDRRARGLALRERVVREHSVDRLADQLVKLLRSDSR